MQTRLLWALVILLLALQMLILLRADPEAPSAPDAGDRGLRELERRIERIEAGLSKATRLATAPPERSFVSDATNDTERSTQLQRIDARLQALEQRRLAPNDNRGRARALARRLTAALAKGDESAVLQLLASGADVNTRDQDKQTPLGAAAVAGNTLAASIEQITFEESLEGFWAFFLALPNRRRRVPVPRRTLRTLAAGFGRAETAYIIAALIRSVFWHKESGLYRTDGRTNGSWVAETFGLSRRAVTAARSRLIELGWLNPLEAPQWALNRSSPGQELDRTWWNEAYLSYRTAQIRRQNPGCGTDLVGRAFA